MYQRSAGNPPPVQLLRFRLIIEIISVSWVELDLGGRGALQEGLVTPIYKTGASGLSPGHLRYHVALRSTLFL